MKFLEARRLADGAGDFPERPLRLCLSGTMTPLDLYLRAHAARHGVRAVIDELPFGTLQQFLRGADRDAARDLLLLAPWDLLPSLDWRSGIPAAGLHDADVDRALDDMEAVLAAHDVPRFYLPAPVPPVAATPEGQRRLEARLEACALRLGAHVLPRDAFGLSGYLAHGAPIAPAACHAVAERIVTEWMRAPAVPRKLLVTDLDGVMWRGVVGEDGPHGVTWGAEGAGYPHFLYQTLLRRLRGEGVLLAVASRNDDDLARAPFRLPGAVLREEDFVAVCTGYGEKSALIGALASELGLGLEAILFVDDNPVELAEVAGRLPEVRALRFPATLEELPAFLQGVRDAFPAVGLTDEDLRRTELYRHRRASAAPEGATGDALERFLRALEMRLVVSERAAGGRERAVQLINKTNQFNLNGVRRSAEEVDRVLAEGGRLFVGALEDRHGSHGEVLACVVEPDRQVSSLVMSCRVLQRGVEFAFASWLADTLGHHDAIRLAYRPTERNAPFRRFLGALGVAADASAGAVADTGPQACAPLVANRAQLAAAGQAHAAWVRVEEAA